MPDNPFSFLSQIAERRISEAAEAGAFDNLPGAGKPLNLEDESHIPEELRMAWKLLKNAGYIPPELAERKEINDLLDMLEKEGNEREKILQMRKLDFMLMRAGARRQRNIALERSDPYYEKVLSRLKSIRSKMEAGKKVSSPQNVIHLK